MVGVGVGVGVAVTVPVGDGVRVEVELPDGEAPELPGSHAVSASRAASTAGAATMVRIMGVTLSMRPAAGDGGFGYFRRSYFSSRLSTRSASGLPPVWQVGQYWNVLSL